MQITPCVYSYPNFALQQEDSKLDDVNKDKKILEIAKTKIHKQDLAIFQHKNPKFNFSSVSFLQKLKEKESKAKELKFENKDSLNCSNESNNSNDNKEVHFPIDFGNVPVTPLVDILKVVNSVHCPIDSGNVPDNS